MAFIPLIYGLSVTTPIGINLVPDFLLDDFENRFYTNTFRTAGAWFLVVYILYTFRTAGADI
ncbi:MAG: hypothetical protein OXU23_28635 [Candidatus Poribacteria bacterium]|nr:hypothetical protein [Candidatus Poribacteria bacterium]